MKKLKMLCVGSLFAVFSLMFFSHTYGQPIDDQMKEAIETGQNLMREIEEGRKQYEERQREEKREQEKQEKEEERRRGAERLREWEEKGGRWDDLKK